MLLRTRGGTPQFKPKKKADKNNARILVRILHTGDLPISYLFTKEIDDIRTMIRYSRSLGYRRKIYK